MPKKQNLHVTPHKNGGWQVKGAGNTRASACTTTQAQAIEIAREMALKNKSEVVIHGLDGRIREKNSYGNDPYPPRG